MENLGEEKIRNNNDNKRMKKDSNCEISLGGLYIRGYHVRMVR